MQISFYLLCLHKATQLPKVTFWSISYKTQNPKRVPLIDPQPPKTVDIESQSIPNYFYNSVSSNSFRQNMHNTGRYALLWIIFKFYREAALHIFILIINELLVFWSLYYLGTELDLS